MYRYLIPTLIIYVSGCSQHQDINQDIYEVGYLNGMECLVGQWTENREIDTSLSYCESIMIDSAKKLLDRQVN